MDDLRIYSLDDDRIKKVGQILANDKSRRILKILSTEELHLKEIAKRISNEENPRLSVYNFQLNKMVKAGLATYTMKRKNKNKNEIKYYKTVSSLLIVPEKYAEKTKNNMKLREMINKFN